MATQARQPLKRSLSSASRLKPQYAMASLFSSLRQDSGPSVVPLITVLRLLTLLSGLAVAANEWSYYKDGKICSRYLKPGDTYFICAGTVWQLAVLTATRVSAGAVLACLIGRAGLATFALMILTIAPMAVKYIKKNFSYEIRKLVHYLALAMM
eukprot:16988-Heterococcus_DN1.PRE.2